MVYLIIGVALLVIIAPIIAVLPSKRQREQMALRKKAMSEGFSIELTSIEDPDPDREKYLSSTGKPLERKLSCAAYRFQRKRPSDWRRLPVVNYAVVRRKGIPGTQLPGEWAWESQPPREMADELKDFYLNNLPKLPADVVRVDESKYVFSIYWRERGDEGAVAAIVAFTKGCMEISPFDPGLLNGTDD